MSICSSDGEIPIISVGIVLANITVSGQSVIIKKKKEKLFFSQTKSHSYNLQFRECNYVT